MSPAPAVSSLGIQPPSAVPLGVGAAGSHPAAGSSAAGPLTSSAPPPPRQLPSHPSSSVRRRSRSVSTSSSLGSHLASDEDDDEEGDELETDDDEGGVEAATGLARLDRPPPVPQGEGPFVKKAKHQQPHGSPPAGSSYQQQQQHHQQHQQLQQQQQSGGNQPARKQNVVRPAFSFPLGSFRRRCLRAGARAGAVDGTCRRRPGPMKGRAAPCRLLSPPSSPSSAHDSSVATQTAAFCADGSRGVAARSAMAAGRIEEFSREARFRKGFPFADPLIHRPPSRDLIPSFFLPVANHYLAPNLTSSRRTAQIRPATPAARARSSASERTARTRYASFLCLGLRFRRSCRPPFHMCQPSRGR